MVVSAVLLDRILGHKDLNHAFTLKYWEDVKYDNVVFVSKISFIKWNESLFVLRDHSILSRYIALVRRAVILYPRKSRV